MPFVIPALVSGVAGALASGSVLAGVLSFGSELVLGGVRALLAPKPKRARLASIAQARTINLREPVQPRRAIYGETRVGGPILYIGTSGNRSQLNFVVALASHEVESIGGFMLDDTPLTAFKAKPGVDPGEVQAPARFKGKAQVSRHVGADTQAADAFLQAATAEWTSAHQLGGIAYLAVQLVQGSGETVFAGLPTVTALVRGKRLFDPRDGATRWSPNPALCLRDYLTDGSLGLGLPAAKIDDDELIAAANICEEMVPVKPAADAFTADPSSDLLTRASGNARWLVGDAVNLASSGTLPAPLLPATDYYVIPLNETTFKLAGTYANALAGAAIDVTSAGSGTHTATRVKEPRYALNGTFESDEEPGEIIERMLSAMAGRLVISGGKWIVRAGAFAPPTVALDMDDLRGAIEVETKIARRDRFNAVKGLFVSPDNNWQPSDFPAVTDPSAEAEDGQRIFADIELPFTTSSGMAQRLAKIALLKSRQETSVKLRCKLAGFRLVAGDTVAVTYPRFNWTNKTFEVQSWRFIAEEDPQGAPVFGIDIVARESAAAVYDYDAEAEQVVAELKAPSTIEDLLALRPSDVTGFSVAQVGDAVNFRWNAVNDVQLAGYEIRFGPAGNTSWENATPLTRVTKGTAITNAQVPPGNWTFFIKAFNTIGVGNESGLAAEFDTLIDNAFDVILANEQAPDWLGVRSGLVKHWSGVLVLESQDTDSTEDDVMDACVIRPVTEGFYEAPEQDLGQDATVRAWAEIDSVLAPEETGIAAPQHQIDYRLSAGAFDGFEPWPFGNATARFFKQRFRVEAALGVAVVKGFKPVLDLEERTESIKNAAVAAAGTTFAYARPFLKSPRVKPTVIGGAGLIPDVTNLTTASFKLDLYNTAGVSVGGVADVEVTGV